MAIYDSTYWDNSDRIALYFRPDRAKDVEKFLFERNIDHLVEEVNGYYKFVFLERDRHILSRFFDLTNSQKIPAGENEEKKEHAGLDGQIGAANHQRSAASSPSFRTVQRTPQPVRSVSSGAEQPSKVVSQTPSKWSAQDIVKDLGVLSVEEQKRIKAQKKKAAEDQKPKKERLKTGRDNQVKTRLTDNEMILFSDRVKASGMKQGDFMRECLLHETVNVRSLTEIDAKAFGLLMEMASDLGRIGGLIKGTVVVNKDEFAVLTLEDKENLEEEIRELNRLKEKIMKVVSDLYGNS